MRMLIGAALVVSMAMNLFLAARGSRCGGAHQPRTAVREERAAREEPAPDLRSEVEALRAEVSRVRAEAASQSAERPSPAFAVQPVAASPGGAEIVGATARELGIDEASLRAAVAMATRELATADQRMSERAAALPPDLPDEAMERACEAMNEEYATARAAARRFVEALLDGRASHARFREELDGWLEVVRLE